MPAKPRVAVREKTIEDSIRTLLKAAGAKTLKYHVGWLGSIKGTPDLIGCYKGVSFVIEVKRPGEVSTEKQCEQQEEWRKAGAIVFVAHGVNDVIRLLFDRVDGVRDRSLDVVVLPKIRQVGT